LGELRPTLHRYCARMTGSVIDGEDVVQETMLKAMQAAPAAGPITNPEGWLFGIAHHAALDFLRRRAREEARHATEDLDMIADVRNPVADRQSAATSLRTFMRLPVSQRSSVILCDVLGHSLQEICEIVGGSVPAVKAALQRGRSRLRALAAEADDAPVPALPEPERTRLKTYVEHFNAHDFDAVRAMLAEDVRLEVVNRVRVDGKKHVAPYFSNYAARGRIGGSWRASSTAAPRCSSMTPTIPISGCNTSCSWRGPASGWSASATSSPPATPWTGPSSR